MEKKLLSIDETIDLLRQDKSLILAGDEKVLSMLPGGNWIGGSIPYFIGENGGEFSKDKIYVTEIPDFAVQSDIKYYDVDTIHNIYHDSPSNGFTFVIIPAFSNTHLKFAINAPSFENFAASPLIGWISGYDLDDPKGAAKIFSGIDRKTYSDGAIVFSVKLPASKTVDIEIINIFDQGNKDIITFPEDGFFAKDALVNGKKVNFAEYLINNKIDNKYPLVADMYGAKINTSFQSLDEENMIVNFYAPVFQGIEYKIGYPVGNYVEEFLKLIPVHLNSDNIYFSCNCILNYLYAGLEGVKTGEATGPITFGEIAYQLLNQTMVYMTIEDIPY